MQIEQIYTGCLSQGSYYITSAGEAVIIDPLREVEPYLERAQRDGVKIKFILETQRIKSITLNTYCTFWTYNLINDLIKTFIYSVMVFYIF